MVMELRQGVGDWSNWYEVVNPSRRVLDYIKYTVRPTHRRYDSETFRWYVHSEYFEKLHSLMNSEKNTVIEDDPYAILHLRSSAPRAIIKAVWRELAKSLHPDHGGKAEDFIKAKAAYEKLVK